jgi:hypothetical protein
VSDQDLRILLRLLDKMDDHFDGKISGREFLLLAAFARDCLSPSAVHDQGLAAAVRALDALLGTATSDRAPAEPTYSDLRFALADLEELR